MTAAGLDTTIVGIDAREILDSRGNPTVEVDVILAAAATAATPAGRGSERKE